MSVFSHVQSASAISANSLAFTSNNTSGNIIVAMVASFHQTLATAVTDTNGNTYVKVADAGTVLNGYFQVWVATGITGGANTLSFTTMITTDTNIIIAEYGVPTDFHLGVSPLYSKVYSSGAMDFSFPDNVIGAPVLPSEIMLICFAYNWSNFRSWTISNGTVRQTTHEADGATTALGDYSVVSPSGVVTTTLTATGGSGEDYVGACLQLFIFPSGGGGGGGTFFACDMSGGFSG